MLGSLLCLASSAVSAKVTDHSSGADRFVNVSLHFACFEKEVSVGRWSYLRLVDELHV